LQHRGDGLASRRDRRCSRARRTRHSRPRSSGMARLEDAPSAAQHYTRVIAAEIARTQPGRKYLAVHEGQLAVKPSLHLLHEHRRPLLLCLEQTGRPAMADHVHRNSQVGNPVMLLKTWYYPSKEASRPRRTIGPCSILPVSRSPASTKSSAARRTANGIGPFYSCQTAAWKKVESDLRR